jgi:hypothetical protein
MARMASDSLVVYLTMLLELLNKPIARKNYVTIMNGNLESLSVETIITHFGNTACGRETGDYKTTIINSNTVFT